MDGTFHTCAPLQVSSLATSSRTTSSDLLPAAPKSRPVQRPDSQVRPRIRAPIQLNSQRNSLATLVDVSHAMFVDVSQLQYAEPLQRPTPTSVPVTSAPMPTHRTPLPAPQMRSGYRPSSGPQLRLNASAEGMTVSQMQSNPTKLPSRSTRKLNLHTRGPKQRRLLQTSRGNACSTCPAVQSIWPQFVSAFLGLSPMLQELSTSAHFDEHCQRILDGFASSTIYRYLSTLMQFHAACISMRVSLEGLTEIQFADIILAGRSSEPRVSPSMCIKSVRWAFKQFGIQCFQVSLGPLISSFTKEHVISDRREALPYSLLIIIQWERRLLQSSATQQEVLGLGSLLLMLWSGMRFADLQRTYLSSLAYNMTSLRGCPIGPRPVSQDVPSDCSVEGFCPLDRLPGFIDTCRRSTPYTSSLAGNRMRSTSLSRAWTNWVRRNVRAL